MLRTCRTEREFHALIGTALLGCAYFGWQAHTLDQGNRIEGVGGPDCDNSNQLAFILLAVLPFAGLWILKGNIWMRLVGLGAAPLIMNALILTRSRGGFLGGIVMTGLCALLAPRKYRLVVITGAFLGVLSFLWLADPYFWERMQSIQEYDRPASDAEDRDRDDAAVDQRLVVWRGALRAMLTHPQGLGADNFIRVSRQYAPELTMARVPHNTWLHAGAEFGFLGLLALLGLVFKVSVLLLRDSRRHESPELSLSALALLVGFWGALVSATFSDRLFADALYWIMAWACILHGLLQPWITADQEILHGHSPGEMPG
jgi:O-antigen ligase